MIGLAGYGPFPKELLSPVSDILIWAAIGVFLLSALFEFASSRSSRRSQLHAASVYTGALAWGLFGVFWLTMFPYFYYDVQSPLQGVLSLIGLPVGLYTAYLLATGRDSLLVLTRAVGFMGLIYLPITAIEPVKTFLIETVALQTQWGMGLLGYNPALEAGANGYVSRFVMEPYSGETYSTYIVLACTGIGSISIFGGLIAAVKAPLTRKIAVFSIATGVIWVANLARNVFVGLAAPLGWFDYGVFHSITALLAGDGMRTSFFISHHVISQVLSIVALIGITFMVVKLLPQSVGALEELLFVLTGDEYDLSDAIGIDEDVRDSEPAAPADD